MQTVVRRFLVLAGLMLWQGGFTFYAAIVVPIGMDELGSHTAQGFITRRVAPVINLAGLAALALLVWDMVAQRDARVWRRRARWFCLIALSAALTALFLLYPRMDELLDSASRWVRDPEAFGPLHKTYLIISTVQWAFALAYLWLMLGTWRDRDAAESSQA